MWNWLKSIKDPVARIIAVATGGGIVGAGATGMSGGYVGDDPVLAAIIAVIAAIVQLVREIRKVA